MHRTRRSRSRRMVRPGHWHVHARVERFIEPTLLLLLREGPMHGYELLERSPEEEGIVTSEWDRELPGPAKRTYALTPAGQRVLDKWAEALRRAETVIDGFLQRYDEGRERG